jgi:predicted lipase
VNDKQDCVYCVVRNNAKRQVTVVFRGSVNLNDWQNNIRTTQVEVANPVKKRMLRHTSSSTRDDEPDEIGIHYGFHAFLLRERQNLRKTDGSPAFKVDRIISRVDRDIANGWT